MKVKICAFTGHRPHKLPWKQDETDSRCVALKIVLAEQIASLVDAGFTQILSGMAEGADTWATLSVLALRKKNPIIKLHCILACTTQADLWTANAQNLYHSILNQADSIVYVNRNHSKNDTIKRNHFMVDHASTLLAVCKNVNERRGGTASTIRYAQKTGKNIILLDPISLKISNQ